MRLIDADALKSLIYEEYDDERYGYISALDIDCQPTITIIEDIYKEIVDVEARLIKICNDIDIEKDIENGCLSQFAYYNGRLSATSELKYVIADMMSELYDDNKKEE